MPTTKRFILLTFSGLIGFCVKSQTAPLFIVPMDIPLQLAGNFMEPRSDHFHSGLDIRTQGREGVPVKAVADGWVSRIKISPWGYGKAVYIDHPSGHTTVYGHLQQLLGAIGEACLAEQYRQKDFSIDWTLEKGALPVTQGEVFALSGNTGGSGGPHLHFEIRRASDQHALDPQDFGITIPDHKKPEIHGVRLYALTDSSRTMPYPGKAVGFAAQGAEGKYTVKDGVVLTAYGTVGLAIHTLDRYDENGAKCGVRSIELIVDSVPVFTTRFEQLDFGVNRYCNAHMDYGQFKGNKFEYHRCYRQPNNKLRIYGKEEAQGRITLAPGQIRHVRFLIIDASGNKSTLSFDLHGATAKEAATWPKAEPEGSLFRYDAENDLTETGIRFHMPALALYDDAYVRYATKPALRGSITPVHTLGDPMTPIQTPSDLSLALQCAKPGKAVIVRVDADGSVASSLGGRYADGWITAPIKVFGTYTVMLDTVPPVIVNLDLRADMHGRKDFSIKIGDNLSGVEKWTGTLNGEWILLEYDPKTKLITHTFDSHSKAPGKKEFNLTVTDDRGNSSSYAVSFSH